MDSSGIKQSPQETGKSQQDITPQDLVLYNDQLVFRIAEFSSVDKAALVNKTFLEAATKVAASMLAKIKSDHRVDPKWEIQLSGFIFQNYKRFYSNNPPPKVPFPTLHPRLFLQAAFARPLAQHVSPHVGPSVVLPNGNLAMACDDNSICILDTKQMTWTTCSTAENLFDPHRFPFGPMDAIAERWAEINRGLQSAEFIAAVLREGGIRLLEQLFRNAQFSWITDHLFYSEGHLVLHQRPIMGIFGSREFLHVWKLEGEGQDMRTQHLYTKDLKGDCLPAGQEPGAAGPPPPQVGSASSCKGVVVAPNGVFYCLREIKETADTGVSYLIQSFDVGTGNCVATETILMPQGLRGGKRPRYTTNELFLTNDYLWFTRHAEEEGPFPGIGLGLYSFCRTDLSLKCFLPCFEEGEIWINTPMSGQSNDKWILTRILTPRCTESFFGKVSIDEVGAFTQENKPIKFGCRDEVKYVSGNRVFLEHPDEEGDIRFDEFDVATGEKIRTLSTGLPRRGEENHMVASVHSNASAIFCIISTRSGSTIQTFLI